MATILSEFQAGQNYQTLFNLQLDASSVNQPNARILHLNPLSNVSVDLRGGASKSSTFLPRSSFVSLQNVFSNIYFEPWNQVPYMDVAFALQAINMNPLVVTDSPIFYCSGLEMAINAYQVLTTGRILVESYFVELGFCLIQSADPEIAFDWSASIVVQRTFPSFAFQAEQHSKIITPQWFWNRVWVILASMTSGSAFIGFAAVPGYNSYTFSVPSKAPNNYAYTTSSIFPNITNYYWLSPSSPLYYLQQQARPPPFLSRDFDSSPSARMFASIVGFDPLFTFDSPFYDASTPVPTVPESIFSMSMPNYYEAWSAVYLYATFNSSGVVGGQTVSQLPFIFQLDINDTFASISDVANLTSSIGPPVPVLFSHFQSFCSIQSAVQSILTNLNELTIQIVNNKSEFYPLYANGDRFILLQFAFFDPGTSQLTTKVAAIADTPRK